MPKESLDEIILEKESVGLLRFTRARSTRKIKKQYSRQVPVQWPRGLRRGSAAARLLRMWVRIPPVVWMFVY